jgi:hypothetical protein
MAAIVRTTIAALGLCACLAPLARAGGLQAYGLRGDQPAADSGAGLNEEAEVGLRFWYSSGKLAKTLYAGAGPSAGNASRLTYSGLTSYSEELYGRFGADGFFLRGSVGLSQVAGGSLRDEDFAPLTTPYSSTNSDQRFGRLTYATVDYGFNPLRSRTYQLGVFAGFRYSKDSVNAYGCTQTATNPAICAPGVVGANIDGITQDAQWMAPRIGISAAVLLFDRLRLTADAAWLPYVWLDAQDTHHLRPDLGPIREVGTGRNGIEFQATAAYQITRAFSLGVGVRYWHMTADAKAKFVDRFGNFLGSQGEHFQTDRFGVFAQASYSFL